MTARLKIVIPTYNRAAYLQETLASVLNQTFKDFDLAVIDNGSTEDYSAVRVFLAQNEIEYRRIEVNQGFSSVVGEAITGAKDSEYVMVFHDDDLMHPRMLEQQIKRLDDNKEIGFISTAAISFSGGVPKFQPAGVFETTVFSNACALAEALVRGLEIPFPSVIYRTSIASQVEPRPNRFSVLWDRPFLMDCAKLAPAAFIHSPLMLTRCHGVQVSNTSAIASRHVVELFAAYLEVIGTGNGGRSLRRFYKWTGKHAIPAYTRLGRDKPSLWAYLRSCRKANVIRYPFLAFFLSVKGAGLKERIRTRVQDLKRTRRTVV